MIDLSNCRINPLKMYGGTNGKNNEKPYFSVRYFLKYKKLLTQLKKGAKIIANRLMRRGMKGFFLLCLFCFAAEVKGD